MESGVVEPVAGMECVEEIGEPEPERVMATEPARVMAVEAAPVAVAQRVWMLVKYNLMISSCFSERR